MISLCNVPSLCLLKFTILLAIMISPIQARLAFAEYLKRMRDRMLAGSRTGSIYPIHFDRNNEVGHVTL